MHSCNAQSDHVVALNRHGVDHANGIEQSLLQLLLKRSATHSFNGDRGQVIAAIVVNHCLARCEVAARLPHLRGECGSLCRYRWAAGQEADVEIAARAATVLKEFPERRVTARAGEFEDIAANRHVEIESALLGQQQR